MGDGRTGLLNILTAMLLAATLAVSAGYLAINLNPDVAARLFPPPAGVAASLAELPTPLVPLLAEEAAATQAAATRTPSPTVTRTRPPSATPTRTVTPTRTISPTPVNTLVVIPTTGPSPTATWTRSPFQFTVQGGGPIAGENVFNLSGCDWLGVGGQVYDLRGGPLIGYVVNLSGGGVNSNSLSGTQPQYGPAGYEFKIASAPKRSSGIYRVQLRNAQNVPVSDWIEIETFDDCAKNVLLVNFVQNH
jgi:hypothetical protein